MSVRPGSARLRWHQPAALVHGCTALPPKGPLIHPPHAPRAAHNHDMKSRVHPKYKTKDHVRNWASYERALVHRGDVTVWLSPAALAAWEPDGGGRRGGALSTWRDRCASLPARSSVLTQNGLDSS